MLASLRLSWPSLTQDQSAKLALAKNYIKNNWLRAAGYYFICQAGLEYFTRHTFTCCTVASLLLMWKIYTSANDAILAGKAKDANRELFYATIMVLSMVCLIIVSIGAVTTMPPELREWIFPQRIHFNPASSSGEAHI